MQIDMHFYGVYALCRLAGIGSEPAQTIAYASQFVDDKVKGTNLIFRHCQKALPPVMTSHKPIDYMNAVYEDQWKVWAAFHFLPGNESDRGLFEEKMICRKNCELAQLVMDTAIANSTQAHGLHAVGVAAHSFADTFAHYGFIGISSDWNKVKEDSIQLKVRSRSVLEYITKKFSKFLDELTGSVAEWVPVGHGAVATYPDRPYLQWEYQYEKGRRPKVKRENGKDYGEAARLLHAYFGKLLTVNPSLGNAAQAVDWDVCQAAIDKIICKEGTKKNRIQTWKKFIKKNDYFTPDAHDQRIHYQEGIWQITQKQLKETVEADINRLPLYLFMTAARNQSELVTRYLREKGLIVQ